MQQCSGTPDSARCLVARLGVYLRAFQHDMAQPARTQLLGRVTACEKNVQCNAQSKNIRPVISLHNTELLRRGKSCCSKRTGVFIDMAFVEPCRIEVQQVQLSVCIL